MAFLDQLWGTVIHMAGEVISLEELLEVVRETNRVKLNAVFEGLYTRGMDISVRVSHTVQISHALNDLLKVIQHFHSGELSFQVGFPLAQDLGCIHLNENKLLRHNPILTDRH